MQDEDICAPGVPSYVDEMMQLIKQLQMSKISSLEAENVESTEPSQPQSGKILFSDDLFVINFSSWINLLFTARAD